MSFKFNFEVATGVCLGIMGKSGSGKSTLLNLIAGFLSPSSGQISFNQQRIDELRPHQRPLTILFQEHNLFNHLSVFQNIGLGLQPSLKLSDKERNSIYGALEKVDLAGLQDRLPESLSGGQRQRVAIARCLVRSKPLLLLDEPFGGLNQSLKLEIKQLLKTLQEELNLTLLWVTHDHGDVDGIADDVIEIRNGKLSN